MHIKLQNVLLWSATAVALLVGCHTDKSASSVSHAPDPGAHPHWSYTGDSGASHWGSLSPEYALCATGHSQSPIDIKDPVGKDLANIDFHYGSTPVVIV